MKIVYFGSSEFAVRPLESLLEQGHDVSLVVTQPDRMSGRGLKLTPTPVKLAAVARRIPVFDPRDFSESSCSFLDEQKADLFVVVAYGRILPERVLSIPAFFCLNLHASLLPKYRGAAPVNWALMNGERRSGVSVIRMSARMDAGDIILQAGVDVADDDNALTLSGKLSSLGSSKLLEALEAIGSGSACFIKQDEQKASFAPKIKKSDGIIDWGQSAQSISDRVRALAGWPCAFSSYKGITIKIHKVSVIGGFPSSAPGEVLKADKSALVVGTGCGSLSVEDLQPASSRIMKAQEFVAGHDIKAGDKFI